MKNAFLTATAMVALLALSTPAHAAEATAQNQRSQIIIDEPATPQALLADNNYDRPQFQPTVDAPASSGKPAIVSKPPSMPPAVLPPIQPRPAAAPASPYSSNGPVEAPPAAPPAAVEAPEALPAPVAPATPAPAAPAPEAAPAAAPAPIAAPAPESAIPPAKDAIEEAAPIATPAAPSPTEQSADVMPVVPTMSDLTLDFGGNTSELTPETRQKLDNLVKQMNDTFTGRIQVRGFATGEDGGKSSARRISLARVLSVRSYLMDKGIKPARVDVRAMGTETDRSPLDRVDLIFERD